MDNEASEWQRLIDSEPTHRIFPGNSNELFSDNDFNIAAMNNTEYYAGSPGSSSVTPMGPTRDSDFITDYQSVIFGVISSNESTPDTDEPSFTSNTELLMNDSQPTSHSSTMLTNSQSNLWDVVSISPIAGPAGSSSMFDDVHRTLESSSSTFYDSRAQPKFQGVNDNLRNYMKSELPTPAMYQADHYPPDLHMDRQVPPNCIRNETAEENHDCRKMIQHDAGDQKEEFLHPSAGEPLDSGKRLLLFLCEVCGEFHDDYHLERHRRMHTGDNPYKCDECDYETLRSDFMNQHLRKHTGEKPYKCDLCNYKTAYSDDLTIHMRTHTGEKPHKCNLCSYEAAHKANLETHMRTHTAEKPHKCDLCNYKAARSGDLTLHMRTHTGEKPYKCNLCNYESVYSGHLKDHMRTHTGEKPYKCDLCNYKTARSGNLTIHMRTHTGEKPHKCDLCNYKTGRSGDLTIHMRTHSGEKPYKCDLCNYETAISGNLKVHMRIHTGEKPYKCDLCNYETAYRRCLKEHMLKFHK